MYRRLTALTLSLALLLSGCSGLLERSQRTVNPHVEQAASEGDPSVLRAENYQSLVSAVLHFVSEGMERGKVRLYKYTGNIGDDLASACDEVMLEDPLGAYALEDIDWNYNRIVSYYECSFQFTYRRTAEQIQSVRSVNGVTAIRNALEEAMAAGQTEAVLRVSSYYAGEAWIGQLFGEAYQELGLAAVAEPTLSLSVYPDSGSQRIVECLLDYGMTGKELAARREEALSAAQDLVRRWELAPEKEAAAAFADSLSWSPEGGSDVYGALTGDGSSSLGVAMAMQGVCHLMDLGCTLVEGTRNGESWYWNQVTLSDKTRWCVDAASGTGLVTAEELAALGYQWEGQPVAVQRASAGTEALLP